MNKPLTRTILLLCGISAGLMSAEEISITPQPAPRATTNARLWRTSVAALSVANVLDVHSSWNKHELNSALAGSSGNFGREGTLIKVGFQGGLLAFEYLITRGHPSGKLYRVLSFANFGAAAAIGGVAAHNYTVPGTRQ